MANSLYKRGYPGGGITPELPVVINDDIFEFIIQLIILIISNILLVYFLFMLFKPYLFCYLVFHFPFLTHFSKYVSYTLTDLACISNNHETPFSHSWIVIINSSMHQYKSQVLNIIFRDKCQLDMRGLEIGQVSCQFGKLREEARRVDR